MPESHHGLTWGICNSDLWALWVRFWHVRRGSCCTLKSLFAYIRYEFGLLPLFPLQFFCSELSVSNYSKSAVLLILSPSWERLFLKGLGSDSFKSFVVVTGFFYVEPAVTGLMGTLLSPAAKSVCWAAPRAGASELSLIWDATGRIFSTTLCVSTFCQPVSSSQFFWTYLHCSFHESEAHEMLCKQWNY